jgi:thiol-disulfide isomerase/thioredoxin
LKFRTTTRLILLVLAWLPFAAISAELETFSEDNRLDFSLADFSDRTRSLADYRGKVVLVNFWASWCPPCIYEMPELTRLKQQMADKPFEIIAINVGEKKYRVRKFTRLVNFELPVLLDTSNKAFNDWGVRTLPTSFLVGADGRVRHKIRGNPGWEQQETLSLIEQLIAETATSAALSN